jgi:hypothetical protein
MRVNSGSGPPTAVTEIVVALTTTASMRRKAKLEKAALKTLAAQQNNIQISFGLMILIFKGGAIAPPFFVDFFVELQRVSS